MLLLSCYSELQYITPWYIQRTDLRLLHLPLHPEDIFQASVMTLLIPDWYRFPLTQVALVGKCASSNLDWPHERSVNVRLQARHAFARLACSLQ